MSDIATIQARISELEQAKANLLLHAADLEAKRDTASTFETLTLKDKHGAKHLDALIAELVTIGAKLTAFDSAIRAEKHNLLLAERAANVEQDQRDAQAALEIVDSRLAANGKALATAMDLFVTAIGEQTVIFAELQALGCSVPDAQRCRINNGFAVATALMNAKLQQQVRSEFLAPHQRTSFDKVYENWEQRLRAEIERRLPAEEEIAA
jgi:uncharacterized protein YbaA (DUF1428 family)